MASQELQGFSKEMEEYLWQLSREKYELDRQDDLVMAKRAGIQKGIQKGKLEGKLEIIELLESDKSKDEILRELRG